jgi:plasmid stability protein
MLACASIYLWGGKMASISVRKLDDQLIEKLRFRAVSHGVSMEEEIRNILARAVSAPDKASDIFLKHFGPKNGLEINESEKYPPHNPMDFQS